MRFGTKTSGYTLPGTPAFFQGYGQVNIDWIALAHYSYERVTQDVIACAENVCLRDDLGEESRANEAQLFQDVLAQGGEIDAATHASTHLSPDLTISIRRNAYIIVLRRRPFGVRADFARPPQ